MSDVFAPEGGFRVRILDLSGASEDHIVEEIKGFPTLMHANAFARAYVRDSVERCRVPGASSQRRMHSVSSASTGCSAATVCRVNSASISARSRRVAFRTTR